MLIPFEFELLMFCNKAKDSVIFFVGKIIRNEFDMNKKAINLTLLFLN